MIYSFYEVVIILVFIFFIISAIAILTRHFILSRNLNLIAEQELTNFDYQSINSFVDKTVNDYKGFKNKELSRGAEYLCSMIDKNSNSERLLLHPQSQICPDCGNILAKRNGKYGMFYGCEGFPNCRFTKNIK